MQYNNNARKDHDTLKMVEYVIFSPGLPMRYKYRILKIVLRYNNVGFTRKEVQEFLDLHKRTAQRLCQYMRETGIIEVTGKTYNWGCMPKYKINQVCYG